MERTRDFVVKTLELIRIELDRVEALDPAGPRRRQAEKAALGTGMPLEERRGGE